MVTRGETHFWQIVRVITFFHPGQFTRSAIFTLLQRMHRARGGLAPSLISHSHRPSSAVSRQLRERSTSSSKKATKPRKEPLIYAARTLLKFAAFRPAPPKSSRTTELTLVNSILDEWHLPTVAERGLRGVGPPMSPDLEECTSKSPSGAGPGALVEIRL